MANSSLLKIFLPTVTLLAACGPQAPILETGFWGGAAGAGAGALIGSIISNGDVAASAGLGAAVGIPLAIGSNLIYTSYSMSKAIEDRSDEIKANQQYIFEAQKEIDRRRHQIRADAPAAPDPALEGGYLYTGPTRANSFR